MSMALAIGRALALTCLLASVALGATLGAAAPYARLAQLPQGKTLLAIARTAMESYWTPAVDPNAGDPPHAASESAGASTTAERATVPPAPDWPGAPAGLYASLVRGHQTRACVGNATPPRGTLADAVRTLAIEVLRADRRHAPVRHDELGDLSIVLSFVVESEPIADPMRVDPGRDGLLVASPRGAVAFLPGEARTIRWALDEARRIGVLRSGAGDATYERLHVVTLSEPPRPSKKQESPDEVP